MSATTPPVVLVDEYLDAARTLRRNTELRKAMDVEDAAAKEILAKVLIAGETGTDADGTPMVKVKAGARVFHEDTARLALESNGLASVISQIEVTVTRLDKDKAKALLPGDIYDACCKVNAASIVVA